MLTRRNSCVSMPCAAKAACTSVRCDNADCCANFRALSAKTSFGWKPRIVSGLP